MEGNKSKKVSFSLYILIAVLILAILMCFIIAIVNGPKKETDFEMPDNEAYEYKSTNELKK